MSPFARRNRARQHRPVEWRSFDTVTTVDAADTISLFQVMPASLLGEYTDPTLMRIRGLFQAVQTTSAEANGVILQIGIGFLITTQVAANAAAVPGPLTNPEENWILLEHWMANAWPLVGSNPRGVPEAAVVLDSRAMRRFQQAETKCLCLIVETAGITASDITYRAMGRMLFKE